MSASSPYLKATVNPALFGAKVSGDRFRCRARRLPERKSVEFTPIHSRDKVEGMVMNRALQYEVLVVGAGPAGSATAYHLARAGIRTLLIDKTAFPRDKVCGDCLSPRAQHYLGRLGILEEVAAEAHQATRIRFRAPSGAEAETSITGDGAMPNRTLVLARRRFDLLVQQHALAAGARFRVGHVRALADGGGSSWKARRYRRGWWSSQPAPRCR
jgi:hypothetical protein